MTGDRASLFRHVHWLRPLCLVGSALWWLIAGTSSGWHFAAASLVATAYSVPVAYWLGRGARG